MTREQYVRKMKADLDRWNRQIAAWEETLRAADGDMRARLSAHLRAWREQRDALAARLEATRTLKGGNHAEKNP